MHSKEPIIEIKNLTVHDIRDGQTILENISFDIQRKKCLAIVGESGSGKSMTVKSIVGLHKSCIRCTGEILFEGRDILNISEKELKNIRGKEIFTIFQDGMSAFDPSSTVEKIFMEILTENKIQPKSVAKEKMLDSLCKVHLKNPEALIKKYPHQLSGGMLQRVMIAIAIALQPKIIIADEPTTALDTITQFEIVKEFIRLKECYDSTMVFISHDLGIVRKLADYIILMKNGELVESGETEKIFETPESEYAKDLIGLRTVLGVKYKALMGR